MSKVAILGANGQVGAELCLLFSKARDIELVPICRTRSGSAFLRWRGIACRHGRVAEATEAPALLGDCDTVVNCILANGSPRDIRRAEDSVIEAVVRFSRPDAVIIHFSTQSVYGDASPGRRYRGRTPYGRAKLATEQTLRRECRRAGKRCFIFRLGHVCGLLQNISADIRDRILCDEVILPATEAPSNTVYTVTIRDAVVMAMSGKFRPATYDLMNNPQWSWREVYEFEARSIGVELRAEQIQQRSSSSPGLMSVLGLPLRSVASHPRWRNMLASTIAYMPLRLSRRAYASWHRVRARREISELLLRPRLPEGLDWLANGSRFPPGLPTTNDSLAAGPYDDLLLGVVASWPDDLPKWTQTTGEAEKHAEEAQPATM